MRVKKVEDKYIITDFNIFEAYRIAVKIEKEGTSLYRYLSNQQQNKELKKVFDYLAGEEREHFRYFNDRLNSLKEQEEEILSPQDKDILTLIDEGIFPPYRDMEKIAGQMYAQEDVVEFALGVEVRSVNFYQACLEHITLLDVRKELAAIIEEEQKHCEVLKNAKF